MTFTHADIQQHLIDFLYGEINDSVRAAFEAHLALCQSCRSEVAAFERTRSAARAVVRLPLAEPVPAGMRARVIAAATRARAPAPVAPVAEGSPSSAPTNVSSVAEPPPRWLSWLRARWAVPTLVSVAALGVLLLTRETVFREASRPLGDNPPAELLPTMPDQGGAPKKPVATVDDRLGTPPSPAPRALAPADSTAEAPTQDSEGTRGEREPTTGSEASRRNVSRKKNRAHAPAKAEPPRKLDRTAMDGLLEGTGESRSSDKGPAAERSAASLRGAGAPVAPVHSAREEESKGFAIPPPSAPVIADPAKVQEPKSVAAPLPPASRPSGRASAGPSAPEATSVSALVVRGETLMAERRWTEAVAVYRDLLRRFPEHPSVPTWRRRMNAARAAGQVEATPPADGSGGL